MDHPFNSSVTIYIIDINRVKLKLLFLCNLRILSQILFSQRIQDMIADANCKIQSKDQLRELVKNNYYNST